MVSQNGEYSFGYLDSPVDNQLVGGLFPVRGWVLDPPGKKSIIEVHIDGKPIAAHINRTERPDVREAFPALKFVNPTPGIDVLLSTPRLSNGRHDLTLLAREANDSRTIASVRLQVHNDPRGFLAARAIGGSGLEIGALQRPLTVPCDCKVKYVDRFDVQDLRVHYPELSDLPLVPVDIIDDGETLTSIAPASQDFVIANHFIEHAQNPIGTVERWLEILRPRGVVYVAVPDKRKTFDSRRPVTPLAHLYRDYHEGPEWSYMEHMREWVALVTNLAGQAFADEVQRLVEIHYSIHFHVWTQSEFMEMLLDIRKQLSLPLEIEGFLSEGNEHIFLLRKM